MALTEEEFRMGVSQWLKQQATIVTHLSVIGGVLAGFVYVTGGHLPPWASWGEFQTAQNNAAAIQKQTVDVLNRINQDVQKNRDRLNIDDCEKLREQLEAVNRTPNDPLAPMLRQNIFSQSHTIEGCSL